MIPRDLTTQPPQEVYSFIQDLETYRRTDGRGRTPEAHHVRQYVREELTRVKGELTRRGLPRVEPGRERSYGPGHADWQKDRITTPKWSLVESQAELLTHLIPLKTWSRHMKATAAVCGQEHRMGWIQVDQPTHALCTECVRLTGYQEETEPDPVPESRECPLKCTQGLIGRSPEGELVFCSCGPGRRAEIAWWENYLTKLEGTKDPRLTSEIGVAKRWITELQAALHRREGAWADHPDHPFEGAVQEKEDWIQEATVRLEEEHLAKARAAIVDRVEDERREEIRRWLKDLDRPQRGDRE